MGLERTALRSSHMLHPLSNQVPLELCIFNMLSGESSNQTSLGHYICDVQK